MGIRQSKPEPAPQIIYVNVPAAAAASSPAAAPAPAPAPRESYNEGLRHEKNRQRVLTTRYEDLIVPYVTYPDEIDVTFESIGGLMAIKNDVSISIILPMKHPRLFAGGRLFKPGNGTLFYGPSGTGKTMVAKAIAKESGSVFINVSLADLYNVSVGESRKRVVALFSLAAKLEPSIIFIDEADSFFGKRGAVNDEVMISMKSEFMSLWYGISTDDKARVMILATTNHPYEFDTAILRRFTWSFEFLIPTLQERAAILKVILTGVKVEGIIDYDYLASLCEGCTGSDLSRLCSDAAYLPVQDLVEAKLRGKISEETMETRPLAQNDLESVLSKAIPSVQIGGKPAATDVESKNPHDVEYRGVRRY